MSKSDQIVARIERELGIENLAARLANDVSSGDLASLLMRVQRERAAKVDPIKLLAAYERDAFVSPCSIDARRLLWLESAAFDCAPAFDAIELSPLMPLGACSAVAPVDSGNVEGSLRGREVLADPSNVLALEASLRRKRDREKRVDLCANARCVRTQRFDVPGFRQHFHMFALCSAGRAEDRLSFEIAALRDHIAVHLSILHHTRATNPHVTLVDRTKRLRAELESEIVAKLGPRFPEASFSVTDDREGARTYYPTLSLIITAADVDGEVSPIGDGGVVDWTAKLLSDRKERCVISGLGTERLCARFGAPA
jgi:hypothetical protein